VLLAYPNKTTWKPVFFISRPPDYRESGFGRYRYRYRYSTFVTNVWRVWRNRVVLFTSCRLMYEQKYCSPKRRPKNDVIERE